MKNKDQEKSISALADVASNVDKYKIMFVVTLDKEESELSISGFCTEECTDIEILGTGKAFETFVTDYVMRSKQDHMIDELKRMLKEDAEGNEEEDDDEDES